MAIPFREIGVQCRWATEARLPDYGGSALRGAFGWALKKSSCALRRQNCANCLLRQHCAYAWIFETERYTDSNSRTVNTRPHPFVIRPGKGCNGKGEEGASWDFSMLLLGEGNDFLPHIVYSIKLMGESGIGAGSRRGLGRFDLQQIITDSQVLYDGPKGVMQDRRHVTELGLDKLHGTVEAKKLRVRFHTPLRLKYKNGLQRTLPFHVLIRACLRRISSLEVAYGGGDPDLDYSGLIRRAESVITTSSTLSWLERQRYSNRQKQKTSLGGLVGAVEYSGDLTEFLDLLDYCSYVHIGKQTVFGLGRMGVQRLDEDNSNVN